MDKIIILTAVLTFISLFWVIGYILLKIGAKNATKNSNRTVVKLNHGDIFKFETQLQAKIHSKMVEYHTIKHAGLYIGTFNIYAKVNSVYIYMYTVCTYVFSC